MNDIAERFDDICERMRRAAARAGRPLSSLRLIAVSKTHGAEAVAGLARHWSQQMAEQGENVFSGPLFGESYMQEAREKIPAVAVLLGRAQPAPVWHFIGRIQSNKAKNLTGNFALIHSVDSLKLATALQKGWQSRVASVPVALDAPPPAPQSVLVQVNVGREPQKSGVDPDKLEALIAGIAAMPELSLQGLMCLPPLSEMGGGSRPYFSLLRELRDAMRLRSGLALPELSMGMSGDFESAIEEGATLVRIGTDIFGRRDA